MLLTNQLNRPKRNNFSRSFFFFILTASLLIGFNSCAQKKWDVLSAKDQEVLESILKHWEKWVPSRKAQGTAPMITFEELYAGLNAKQMKFLDRVRKIDPQKSFGFQGGFLGSVTDGVEFKQIKDQTIQREGKPAVLDPQFLPENVYAAYEKMMQAMMTDIGHRLYIESGYRSPAYQLYTFLFYLPSHNYSLVETGHWVALPGYSEHGAPQQQAIDFINAQGINGDDDGQTVEDFEKLPEYRWLQEKAGGFGFKLSYPRDEPGITFEPWHWHYTER